MLTMQFDLTHRNPLVSGHLVHGRALLPGLSYVDLVLQLFGKYGHRHEQLRIKNTAIYAPLEVAEHEPTPVSIRAEPAGAGRWRVEIRSQGGESMLHACADVEHLDHPDPPGAALDVPARTAGAAEVLDIDEVYRHCRRAGLVHSGAMKTVGKLYRSDDEVLLELALAPEAAADAAEFVAHPALLDAGAVAAGFAYADVERDAPLYLPLCYETFHATGRLTGRCFVRVRAESVRRGNGLLSLALEYFDATGGPIAALGGFTSRTSQAEALRGRAAVGTAANPESAGSSGDAVALVRELVAAELGTAPSAVNVDAGFYELGLDSAALLHIVDGLRQHADEDLSPTLLFEHTSVGALADWLAPRLVLPAASTPAVTRQREPGAGQDLAVVGMSGRYPGSPGLDAFWRNLAAGVDSVGTVPPDRWDWRDHHDDTPGKLGYSYCNRGGFLDDVDRFDPLFFAISPREAVAIDPLERLLLEQSWAALEDAGHRRCDLPDAVGVYVGAMFQDYPLLAGEGTSRDGRRIGLGAGGASIANRVSYFCDLHGPSMMVDTACSSSLSTVHLAARALRSGEVDAALVGGVNLTLHPNKYLMLSQAEFLSAQGRCAAFGSDADGMVPGEGVGVLVLKRVADAERDGDRIHGVIKATAVNHGGKTGGFTVPSPRAQHQVVAAALAEAGIDPGTVGYVEAHGTGTALGDPIEIQGLGRAFDGVAERSCVVGSVKSNIGHTEAAAGIAGLTKVLLQMRHGQLAPTLHAERLNPQLPLQGSPFDINTALRPWHRTAAGGRELPRRAGISSFGAGGSNAHVIVEEYRGGPPAPEPAGPALIVLSARDSERLTEYARSLREFLLEGGGTGEVLPCLVRVAGQVLDAPAPDPQAELALDGAARARLLLAVQREFGVALPPTAEFPTLAALAQRLSTPAVPEAVRADAPAVHRIAHTLQTGREEFDARLAVVVDDTAGLVRELSSFLAGAPSPRLHHGNARTAQPDGAERTVREALRTGDLNTLARSWAGGAAVEFAALHSHRLPPVSLPTYPFARERYWIGDALTGPRPAGPETGTPDPVAVPELPPSAAEVEEAVLTRPRVYQVESSLDDLAAYQATVAELSHICRVTLLRTFREMGVLRVAGQRYGRTELRDRLGVAEVHHRLFDALLALLAEAGFAHSIGDEVVTAELDEHDPDRAVAELDERKRALLERAPDHEGMLHVLEVCATAYPAVLNGRKDPLEVLFPGGSFELMDRIYQNQQHSNTLMTKAVTAYVRARLAADPAATITVVEIGAGTGGTSRGVLAALDEFAGSVRYVYTDVGASFLKYGEHEYGAHGFVEFQQLDIERDPAQQGFAPGCADLVVAGNVLHATKNIDRTLAHTKSLLRPGGMLALFEITSLHELLTIAFGLLEGWWAFEDTDRIPGSPLLSVPMWRRALERSGFSGVRVLSELPVREDRLSEGVLLADSAGRSAVPSWRPAPAVPASAQRGTTPAGPLGQDEPAAATTAPAEHGATAAPSPAGPAAANAAAVSAPEPGAASDTPGRNEFERLVRQSWQEVLGVAEIRDDDRFQDLGGDSIMASRIKARLNDSFPFELELRDMLEASTVAALARLVETEVIDKIDQLPEETAEAMFAD